MQGCDEIDMYRPFDIRCQGLLYRKLNEAVTSGPRLRRLKKVQNSKNASYMNVVSGVLSEDPENSKEGSGADI